MDKAELLSLAVGSGVLLAGFPPLPPAVCKQLMRINCIPH